MNDTKSNYWFKRKRYGFGWTPVTWQGWLCVFILLFIILSDSVLLSKKTGVSMIIYFLILIISIFVMILISIKKGPKPKWRWGKRENDNPHEDL